MSEDTEFDIATILVVDDLAANRKILVALLSHQGHRLIEAEDGREGLAAVHAERPDLVITDVLMPVMDGYELFRELRVDPATSTIPVVFSTAHYGEHEARALALSSGVCDVLTKPIESAAVIKVVNRVLSGESVGRPVNASPLPMSFDREHLRLVTDKLSSKAGKLRIANARLRAVINIGLELASERDSEGLLQKVCTASRDLFGATYVTLGILDRIGTVQRVVAYGTDTPSWIRPGDPVPEMLATVLAERRTLRGGSLDLARLHLPLLHPEAQAFLLAPIASPDHVYGWICFIGNEGRTFTDEDQQLALSLAGHVGRIYENDHFCAVAQKRASELEEAIVARTQADAERLILTERLSLATAVGRVGVWEWNLASNTLTWDATMFEIYGLPPVVSMPYDRWSAAVCREDLPAVEGVLQKAIDEKGDGSAEYRITLPDGSMRDVSMVQRVVLDGRSKVSRVIGVTMDVTERKKAEQVLEQNRKDQIRFKDAFLSHVSHELRSPLTAIKQFTSILLGGSAGELNTEQREYQKIVLRNIGQLQSMINDLIEVTCLETGKLSLERESVSVSDAVTDALNTLERTARDKGITLSRDLPPVLPPAYADQARLRQMLVILLDNAIKFTPAGGTVSILGRLVPDDPRFVLVEVSDTGCGIGPEAAGKIFDRLYQAARTTQSSRQGLGLGLYICKELATRQGGAIWVRSQRQEGSTFSFTLPVFTVNDFMAPLAATASGLEIHA